MFSSPLYKKLVSLIGSMALAFFVAGCGKQEDFVKQQYSQSVAAVGYQVVPAKVDILFVVDNTPSFSFPYNQFQTSLPSLVSSLASQGWNYHMASIPMAPGTTSTYTAPSINYVLVDGSMNTATYPYTGLPNTDYVANGAITNPAQLQMVFPINNGAGSSEQTFRAIKDALAGDNKNFVRDDALLVVVVISNGDDNSGSTESDWFQQIVAATGKSASSVQVYPIVSQSNLYTNTCWSSPANRGQRYMNMASLSGVPLLPQFNICGTNNLSTLVQAISSQLQVTKLAYVTTAIVLDRAPSKIVIKKNGSVIPQDNSRQNGWVSDGYSATPIPTITIPYNLNYRSGYVIRLYGSAQASGSDTLDLSGIEY